jgi:hypothetical protein
VHKTCNPKQALKLLSKLGQTSNRNNELNATLVLTYL